MTDSVNAGTPAPTQASEGNEGTNEVAEGQEAAQGGAGAQGVPGGTIGEAAKEAMRKYRVKIEGQEIEVDEKELIRGYGHQKAAAKALNEGKALRRQAEQVLEMLNSEEHLETLLQKMGKDPRALAEKILARHLEDELMDPRDKELRDAKARLKQIEDMERQQKEALEQKRFNELKTKYMKEYETEFVSALKEMDLPPYKETFADMAKYVHRAAKIGFKMTAKEAAKLVSDDYEAKIRKLVGNADGESLLKRLGEDAANKIRKYDTSKVKNPNAYLQTPPQGGGEHRERGEQRKRLSSREWQLMKRGLK